MDIIFTKGSGRYSHLKCIRDDLTTIETQMPEQGIAPHDMIHFVVEKSLNIKGAFYGQLKAGANINFKLEHNQLSRELADKADIWQAESIVESLQSLLWGGGLNYDSFLYLVNLACSNREVEHPSVTEDQFDVIVSMLSELSEQWKNTQAGQCIKVKF